METQMKESFGVLLKQKELPLLEVYKRLVPLRTSTGNIMLKTINSGSLGETA
jgi:hypothetical protein